MTKYFLLIISILSITLIASCSYSFNLDQTFSSPEEIVTWIHYNITPVYDWDSSHPSLNEWQSPIETLDRRTGDCEDGVILFMYLCNRDLGIKPDMALGLVDGNILKGHYIAKIGPVLYDPINRAYGTSLPYDFFPVAVYGYDYVMLKATVFYTQSVK